jgi:hypothetical protein
MNVSAKSMRSLAKLLLIACILATPLIARAQTNPPVNRDSAVATDFESKVSDYMKLRQKAQTGLSAPKNTDSPTKITDYQRQMAAAIRSARSDAKQGDIFTPEITQLFRKLVSSSLNSEDGTKIRKSYQHAEPLHGLRLGVNESYPDGVPLQSMPPSLLLNLPKLPKELEYRFVGRELVLRDVAANLIVDVIPDLTSPENR